MSKTRHKFPRSHTRSQVGGRAEDISHVEASDMGRTGMDASLTDSPGVMRADGGFRLGLQLRDGLFFLGFFLYLWLVVDLRLVAHCAGCLSDTQPVFFRGWSFFHDMAGHPGGQVEYVGAFLFQLFTHGWLGAMLVTGMAWLLTWCVSGCLAAHGCPCFRFLRHVPALLLVAIYSRYAHCITSIVALLVAIFPIPLYLRVSGKGIPYALACFILVSPAMYAIAGAAYLVFAVTCLLHEIFMMRRWRLAGCCLLVAVLVPGLFGTLLCGIPLGAAFTPQAFAWNMAVPNQPLWAIWLLYLLVPAGLVLRVLAGWIAGWRAPVFTGRPETAIAPARPDEENKSGTPARTNNHPVAENQCGVRRFGIWRIAGWLLPFVIAAGIARIAYAPGERCLRAVDYYAYHEMWDQVLDASRGDPTNPFIVQTVARALCHTGRLPVEMFAYPQSVPALLMGTDEPMSWQWAGIWLDAGFVNAAEHNLAQAQETFGEQPVILKNLAIIHLAKGNLGTAGIYLKALTRTMTLDEWSARYLLALEHDPELSQDARIQWLRSSMPKTDGLIKDRTVDGWFVELLKRNPKNRPAFEYLMALCMVAGRSDKVVENIHRINDFDYARPYLPEHYAEAVVVCSASGKGGVPDLHGWQIRDETLQRFRACMEIAQRCKGDSTALKRELRMRFPGSYFRYLLTGESGIP